MKTVWEERFIGVYIVYILPLRNENHKEVMVYPSH